LNDNDFIIDECEIESADDGIHVRINFLQNDGASRPVVLLRAQLPQLIGAFQREIAPGSVVPIDQNSLQPGANYKLVGQQARRAPDGSVVLSLYVELPDQRRTVILPLPLSPKDQTDMLKLLGGAPNAST
jgi:hypothetical protein